MKIRHAIFLLFIPMIMQAQRFDSSNLSFSGHAWYGFDMEKSRPNQKTYGYSTYEASVGLQTEPEDGCIFAELFGYPMISVGFSVARMGDFQFYDQTHFPNFYSLYGSFERSLLRTKNFSLGYVLSMGEVLNLTLPMLVYF